MKNETIALVTSTLYKNWYPEKFNRKFQIDKMRGDLALRMLSRAQFYKLKVVVIDNGSSDVFIEKVKKLNIHKLVTNFSGTFSAARREGYKIASIIPKVKVIVWIEPEKANLINKSLIEASKIVENGMADIVIPRRSKQALQSLPPFQKKSEITGNNQIRKILQRELNKNVPNFDIFFGPKIFSNKPQILDLFLLKFEYKESLNNENVPPLEQWLNAICFPIILAIINDYKVKDFEVDYIHSKIQTKIEKGNIIFDKKRVIQRNSLIKGVKELLRYYKNPEKSLMKLKQDVLFRKH